MSGRFSNGFFVLSMMSAW